MNKKTYHIITFGCSANKSDSERIATALESLDFSETSDIESTDLLIFNTCSVRKTAEDRVFGQARNIAQIKKKNTDIKIALTGCMMHYGEKTLAKKAPFIDIFFDIRKLSELPSKLGLKAKFEPKEYLSFEAKHESDFRAYIPISYGCNNFCSYCIVPFSRGREYSRPAKEIINEIKNLVKKGYKEIWLLGQNVNSYGIEEPSQKTVWDNKTKKNTKPKIKKGCITFPELLEKTDKIKGDFWIRFTSPHPKDFSDELIDTIAKSKKITNYIHLPVQSGDDEILKKMNRTYTVKHYENLVKKIRKAIPNIVISTDTIVGFSGEKRKHFENTKKLYKKLKFDMAFIAKYSPRPNTASAMALKDDVSEKEKIKRYKELTGILSKTALDKNKKLKNETVRILADTKQCEKIFGRTEGMKLIEIINPQDIEIGKFYNVKITEIGAWKLKGKVI